ncbi:Mor transcription activator family protein [Azoarcus olearius]|uniref:Mor transcription activator family protein n=1 Tax=Azoarcus sp. (strain BH72) TaxID=418699 RepID=UPI000A07A8D6|nr:Mor transcription activator family protein [Azoarcus olearius]
MKQDQTDLLLVIAAAIQALDGVGADDARARARAILVKAGELGHAGADYYLPSFSHLTRDERNARIKCEFNGRNMKEVCRKYGISKRTVYRVMRIPSRGAINDWR